MVNPGKMIYILLSIIFFYSGCSIKLEKEQPKVQPEMKKNIIAEITKEMERRERTKIMSAPPELILPSVYEEPEIASKVKSINFAGQDAPLSQLLFVISQEAGLNLVIDEDVESNKTITINMVNAPIEDALDIAMDISNTYVELRGNIMHVKAFMSKTFEIPFLNITSKSSSSLGGDLLGSAGEANTLTGKYSMQYDSDDDTGNFYKQIEESLKNTLSTEGKYSLNKFSGTLVVTDYRRNIKQVEKVIESLKNFISKQVLIEAKIMEVILNDTHQLGVNWEQAWSNVAGGNLVLGQKLNSGINALLPIDSTVAASIKYSKDSFAGILQAMQTAGTIEVVSNPRLKVMNGHSGVLSSGNMIPYWEKEVEYVEATNAAEGSTAALKPEITYNKVDVLNGISLGVTPIIKENGKVLLNVVPIITNIEGDKILNDANGEVARAPIINVKEAGTTIVTQDDDMVVIGGLISSIAKNENAQTPGLGDAPFFGNLFKRSDRNIEKRELVIILKIDIDETEF
jgi:MSHA biogenesis protein MshL